MTTILPATFRQLSYADAMKLAPRGPVKLDRGEWARQPDDSYLSDSFNGVASIDADADGTFDANAPTVCVYGAPTVSAAMTALAIVTGRFEPAPR